MNLSLLIPEFFALAVLVALMLGEMFSPAFTTRKAGLVTLGGIGLVLIALLTTWSNQGTAFGGVFKVDAFSNFFKLFFALAAVPVVQMCRVHFADSKTPDNGEFFLILWSTLIGMFFLASANDLLVLFISLEIVTLSFYIMAAYTKKNLFSIEAGLKYLILGSLASALVIYGISLVYVGTGATSLESVHTVFASAPKDPLMLLAIVLIASGVGFKIAAVPFQLWVPDVYQGAPTPVVSFLSVGSKAAGFVILLRVFFTAFPEFEAGRTALFGLLAAMTLVYGNLGALVQNNIKRLFGYSSISHAGYLIIGVAAGGIDGVSAVLFYLVAYGISNLTAFMIITHVGKSLDNDELTAYHGLYKRSPFLAGMMFLALLSLAGIPPLAGFFGKFLVLLSAVHHGLGWLALLGALAVAVSLYYYLTIVKKMYADDPQGNDVIEVNFTTKAMLVVMAAGILFFGLCQGPVVNLVHWAAGPLF